MGNKSGTTNVHSLSSAAEGKCAMPDTAACSAADDSSDEGISQPRRRRSGQIPPSTPSSSTPSLPSSSPSAEGVPDVAFEEKDLSGRKSAREEESKEEEGEEEEGEEEEGEEEAYEEDEVPVREELKEAFGTIEQRIGNSPFYPVPPEVTEPFLEMDGVSATFVIAKGLKRDGVPIPGKVDGIPREAVVTIDGVEFRSLMPIFPHISDPAVMTSVVKTHSEFTKDWQVVIWRKDTGPALQPLSGIDSVRELDVTTDKDGKYTSSDLAEGGLFHEDEEVSPGELCPFLGQQDKIGQFSLKKLMALPTGSSAAAKVNRQSRRSGTSKPQPQPPKPAPKPAPMPAPKPAPKPSPKVKSKLELESEPEPEPEWIEPKWRVGTVCVTKVQGQAPRKVILGEMWMKQQPVGRYGKYSNRPLNGGENRYTAPEDLKYFAANVAEAKQMSTPRKAPKPAPKPSSLKPEPKPPLSPEHPPKADVEQHSPPGRSGLPDTPPSLALLKRQLAGMRRAAGASALDQQGWIQLGELEHDIKEREKKRLRYGR